MPTLLIAAAAGLLAALGVLTTVACSNTTSRLDLPPLETVKQVDLDRYLGTWHEIASFPMSFQKGCVNSRAHYSMREDGLIRVLNSCNKGCATGPLEVAEGKAKIIPGSGNAKLEVSFFWPFWGDYWIVDLDAEGYQWAVVGHPGRDYLWVLCRSPEMKRDVYDGICRRLKDDRQYPLERLVVTGKLVD